MARGRLISKTLGSSRKFAMLHKQAGKLAEFAQALYPLVVVNADDFGRMSGDPFTVKHAMFPTSPRREDEFATALTAMHHVGLIEWYEVDGQQVIEVVDFETHQPNLHKRAEKSRFPGNPGSSRKFPEIPGKNLTQPNSTELNLIELNRTAPMRRTDDGFSAFWMVYPKKKSRADAERVWRKLGPSPELCQRIMDAVAAQRNSPQWLRDGGQFIPYPASWLNGRRWEDEAECVPFVPDNREWCHHSPVCSSRERHDIIVDIEQRNNKAAV